MFKSIKTTSLFLIGILFAVYGVGHLSYKLFFGSGPAQPETNLSETIPKDLQEAFNQFENKALFYDPTLPVRIADSVTFNQYLKQMDAAAEYLEPSEYKTFVASQKDNYRGVGMEIEKNQAGQIICFPYSDSPAAAGGVENGDILDAVEDRKVKDLSLYKVAQLLREKEAGEVWISVVKKDGRRKELVIKRQHIAKSSVAVTTVSGLHIIRIHAFSRATKRELKLALEAIKQGSVIVLDVRDNPGGDFYKAIDSAMLLLEKEKQIVSVQSRHARKAYTSTTPALHPASLIYVWQNQNTASAAEVFSAALTGNQRAESIGKTSYGKGIVQDIVELSNGAAIIFTSGYLLAPDTEVYHRQGIAPTYRLAGEQLTVDDYIGKTKDLMQLQRIQKNGNH